MTSVAEKLQRKSQRGTSSKQVRLKLVYIDFWSVVKLSFLISVCLGVVLVVAAFLVWVVLNSTGVFDTVDTLLSQVLTQNFSITDTFGLSQVMLFSFVIAILNVICGTALGAIGALLYNLSVRFTGGLLVGFTNN
ncbi:MAG: DUF3566 domain-containing protein [Micrococcales bacterium]|nr:DUF3566 domain-containing protein [Micrococcales bacterium]